MTMITKYVYENIAGTGFMWHPVTDEGDVLFYPCGELKGVKAFVEACGNLIADKLEDEGNNYGLAFYACGYDGKAQQALINDWAEEGVAVF